MIEKIALILIKGGKRGITEGIELPNQERIRTLGEKENHKYLSILEANAMKISQMRKRKMWTSDNQENFSKPRHH